MPETKEPTLILSLNDAAALLGISPWTLRRWAKAEKVPRVQQDGRCYLFSRDALVEWCRKNVVGG